jgi:hypothetical protein
VDMRFPGAMGLAKIASASGKPRANGGRLLRGMPPAALKELVRLPGMYSDGLWLRRGSGVLLREVGKLLACNMAKGMSSSSSLLTLLAVGAGGLVPTGFRLSKSGVLRLILLAIG